MEFLAQPWGYVMLTLHCAVGVVAAIAARQKGYSYGVWLIWGLVGGTVALIHALWLQTQSD